MTKRREYAVAVLVVAICLAIGGLGGALTAGSVGTWYPTLVKPAWNPPNAVFGPVWTTLYVMMAIAYWLVWRTRDHRQIRRATSLFGLQLILNLAWSALFFGLQRPDLALADILLLLAAVAMTASEFRRHSRFAALLLAPYILWVAYATSLNAAIVWLNR